MKNLITKLENEERLNQEEANALWDLDLFTLGKYAHKKRTKLHGKKSILISIAISTQLISVQIPVNFAPFQRTEKILILI